MSKRLSIKEIALGLGIKTPVAMRLIRELKEHGLLYSRQNGWGKVREYRTFTGPEDREAWLSLPERARDLTNAEGRLWALLASLCGQGGNVTDGITDTELADALGWDTEPYPIVVANVAITLEQKGYIVILADGGAYGMVLPDGAEDRARFVVFDTLADSKAWKLEQEWFDPHTQRRYERHNGVERVVFT